MYPNVRWHPKKWNFCSEKYVTINYIKLIHKTCWILSAFTNQCHCVHLHSHSLLFTAIPKIIISLIHCTGYTALLKILCTPGGMCCHVVMIYIDEIMHLDFLVCKPIWTREEDSVFSMDGFSDFKNVKYTCSGFLTCVCGLLSLCSWLFLWFLICCLVQVSF